jgi:hypothetical protein
LPVNHRPSGGAVDRRVSDDGGFAGVGGVAVLEDPLAALHALFGCSPAGDLLKKELKLTYAAGDATLSNCAEVRKSLGAREERLYYYNAFFQLILFLFNQVVKKYKHLVLPSTSQAL